MLAYQKSHLISTGVTIGQHLEEIKAIATTGKSPTGRSLAPLAEPEQNRLLAALGEISKALDDLLNYLTPEGEQMAPETGGPAAPRMWINILLRTIEELAAEVQSEEMSKHYGKFSEDDAARLKDLVSRLQTPLQEAIAILAKT